MPLRQPIRISLFYILTLTAVTAAIIGVLRVGSTLPVPGGVSAPATGMGVSAGDHSLTQLFVQLLVILVAARLVGRLFVRLGQPAVVGEMTAGILLGPSLFGWLAPGAFAFVFPQSSLGALRLLSQVGVCLFMFLVGMDLDVRHVKSRAHTAVWVSHASIVFPYLLGVGLAYFLFSELAAPGATFTAFALFMGISMSITAFPVLARILGDRGLTRTPLGSTAITCAAVDDVTAWSILAFVVAIANAASMKSAALTLGLVLLFVVIMTFGVRPALPRWLGSVRLAQEEPSKGVLAVILCVLIGAALTTELIGIHALFGAFLAGAVMPDVAALRERLRVRLETLTTVLLLPLFFVLTGLRTQVGLLDDVRGWVLCLVIILIATVGKLGGSAVAARLTGMSWSESLQLGALMNTRGLMQVVALNIGYDLGILSPQIFTMLMIMALATTMLTGPLLSLFGQTQPVPKESDLQQA